jgi:hypothetical protein
MPATGCSIIVTMVAGRRPPQELWQRLLGAVAAAIGGPASEKADYVMGMGTPRGQPLPQGPSVDYALRA